MLKKRLIERPANLLPLNSEYEPTNLEEYDFSIYSPEVGDGIATVSSAWHQLQGRVTAGAQLLWRTTTNTHNHTVLNKAMLANSIEVIFVFKNCKFIYEILYCYGCEEKNSLCGGWLKVNTDEYIFYN